MAIADLPESKSSQIIDLRDELCRFNNALKRKAKVIMFEDRIANMDGIQEFTKENEDKLTHPALLEK